MSRREMDIMSVNIKGWEEERRSFTFTSLNDETSLEFTIMISDINTSLIELSAKHDVVVFEK